MKKYPGSWKRYCIKSVWQSASWYIVGPTFALSDSHCALILHDRLLKAGAWADKLKIWVLLFFCFQTEISCSICQTRALLCISQLSGNPPPSISTCLVIYLSGLQILLLLSLLICTEYLCSHWLDSFPVIIMKEAGVRGSQLAKFSLHGQTQTQASVCLDCECLFMCLCASECVCV